MKQTFITQYFNNLNNNSNNIFKNSNNIINNSNNIFKNSNNIIKNSNNKSINILNNKSINSLNNSLNIYTDGACTNNGKINAKAGIGIYIENMYNISEKIKGKQTNQRAELYAILKALQLINIKNYTNIIIYTD